MHRDIKLENILLHFYDQDLYYKKDDRGKLRIAYEKQNFEKCIIKICDLGFSKEISENNDVQGYQHTILGTENYKPKEVDSGVYDETFDYWSLGILIKSLLEGSIHEINENDQENNRFVINKEIIFSLELREILDYLLKNDRKLRKSCINLLNHKFFFSSSKLTYIDYKNYSNLEESTELFGSCGLNIKTVVEFSPSLISTIYQIGFRPMFPVFMNMYEKVKKASPEKFIELKKHWIDTVTDFMLPLCENEWMTKMGMLNTWYFFELQKAE
jgi:serine/threonine protein kinase